MILNFIQFFFVAEVLDELVYFGEGDSFVAFCLHTVVSLDDHFEEFGGASKQFQFGIPELFELFLFEVGEADFEDLLLIELVGELHEYKDVVVFCLGDHVFS